MNDCPEDIPCDLCICISLHYYLSRMKRLLQVSVEENLKLETLVLSMDQHHHAVSVDWTIIEFTKHLAIGNVSL